MVGNFHFHRQLRGIPVTAKSSFHQIKAAASPLDVTLSLFSLFISTHMICHSYLTTVNYLCVNLENISIQKNMAKANHL